MEIDVEHRGFSATSVNVCDQAKEYLSQKGLAFQERDITQDPGTLADLKKLGHMTAPVIVIDGAVIVGFDSAKIDEYVVGQYLSFELRHYRPFRALCRLCLDHEQPSIIR